MRETAEHIVSVCEKWRTNVMVERHDDVARVLYYSLKRKYDLCAVKNNTRQPHVEPMLHRGDHVYEEKHDLPYADDLSGEEFDSYRYEQAQENVPASPTTPVTKPTSDDEISDTLFGQAEDIFNQLQEQSQMRGRTEILKEAHQREEKHATGGEHMNSGLLEDDSPGRLRRSLEMSDLRPSSHIDAPKEEVQLPGSVHHHLDEFPTSDRTDDVDAAGAEGDIDDAEWEVPRSLQLPNHEDFVPPAESLLSTLDDNTLLDDGDRIARSISSFSIRQSMQIRHYHHVVFTYPDPTPYKVLLTGSFFGWKMSLPMQRERWELFRWAEL
ncbi:unnamed protein product [Heligmosomoides polygyrus]|uniref:AMPK1_CBM domain-containing protein n=1 Tax=Heligmosomoides polygyrus TaxID=6339 RepID=A0A183FQV0_HELPZ|nr:unnamed protein product [Heligmosomoides polygyrus]